jgi:Bacterial Ig-like domain
VWLAMWLLICAMLASGCAKRELPSGGPLDLEPPRVIGSEPDSGASGVARSARLSITFSENMEPRSTNDAVAIAPSVEIRQRRWSGRTMTIVLAESLRAHRTYTLFLGHGARDAHGNNIESGKTVVFSTADSFPRGAIEGEIDARGFAAGGTYLWCYDTTGGHVPDSTARDFDAIGLADKAGQFRISGLAAPGHYRLWAFADLNGNRSFEPAIDILAAVDTVFTLTGEEPAARGVIVHVVNPRAPGRVRGAVIDSVQDSLGVTRILVIGPPDTTRVLSFDADGEGGFDFKLPAGAYRIRAYRDLDRSHTWQMELEPASDLVAVDVPAAGDVLDVRLVLRRPRKVP